MPYRGKGKRVVVVRKRGGSLKSTVDKVMNQVKKTYVGKIKPIGKKIIQQYIKPTIKPATMDRKIPRISNMMLTEEDFERMRRMRNTKPNGLVIDTAPAHPKYRRKRDPNTIQYVMSRLPTKTKRRGFVSLAKPGPIGLQALKKYQ